MAQPADIYDFIVRQGTPSKLPGPWKVFKCDPAFFNLEVAPETLLRRLQSEFKSDDLNRAHVTKGNGKRATVLSPPLADNRSFIVAVRPKAEEKPQALIFAGMDKTLGERWVLDAALADHHVRALLESLSRQLLIVSSAEDLAVLTSMGFPAAPAGGARLSGGSTPRAAPQEARSAGAGQRARGSRTSAGAAIREQQNSPRTHRADPGQLVAIAARPGRCAVDPANPRSPSSRGGTLWA